MLLANTMVVAFTAEVKVMVESPVPEESVNVPLAVGGPDPARYKVVPPDIVCSTV